MSLYRSIVNVEELKKYFDEKFDSIAARQQEAPKKSAIILCKKGNQAQYDHASKVLEFVKAADDAVRANNTDLASKKLKNAVTEITKRMKHIRIADKSESGWLTVNEYIPDEVASDSDDEKRIRRAENEAQRKRKKAQTIKDNFKKSRYDQPASSSSSTNSSNQKPFFRNRPLKTFQYEDKCFGCGVTGHWRIHCPKTTGPQSSIGSKPEPTTG